MINSKEIVLFLFWETDQFQLQSFITHEQFPPNQIKEGFTYQVLGVTAKVKIKTNNNVKCNTKKVFSFKNDPSCKSDSVQKCLRAKVTFVYLTSTHYFDCQTSSTNWCPAGAKKFK